MIKEEIKELEEELKSFEDFLADDDPFKEDCDETVREVFDDIYALKTKIEDYEDIMDEEEKDKFFLIADKIFEMDKNMNEIEMMEAELRRKDDAVVTKEVEYLLEILKWDSERGNNYAKEEFFNRIQKMKDEIDENGKKWMMETMKSQQKEERI